MTSFRDTWEQAKALAEKSKADAERVSDEIARIPGWKLKPMDKYGTWKAEHRKAGIVVTAPGGDQLLERVRTKAADLEREHQERERSNAELKAKGIRR